MEKDKVGGGMKMQRGLTRNGNCLILAIHTAAGTARSVGGRICRRGRTHQIATVPYGGPGRTLGPSTAAQRARQDATIWMKLFLMLSL